MGSAVSNSDHLPVQAWPLKKILTRMAGWPHYTEDEQREFYVTACESLTLRLKLPGIGEKWCQEFLSMQGPEHVVTGLEMYKSFEVNIRMALDLLIHLCSKFERAGMRVLELNMLDLLEEGGAVMAAHTDDEYIKEDREKLARVLSGAALRLARREIGRAAAAFRCCAGCGRAFDPPPPPPGALGTRPSTRTAERRGPNGEVEEGGIMVLVGDARDSDDLDAGQRHHLEQVRQVVGSMAAFPREGGVQELGCAALLAAAEHGDGAALVRGEAPAALAAALGTFPTRHGVVWKACRAAALLAAKGTPLKVELGKRGVVQALVRVVAEYEGVETKQLALLALSACADQGNNVKRMVQLDIEHHIKKAKDDFQLSNFKLHTPDTLQQLIVKYHQENPAQQEPEPEPAPTPRKERLWDNPRGKRPGKFGTADALFEGGEKGLV